MIHSYIPARVKRQSVKEKPVLIQGVHKKGEKGKIP